MRQLERRSETGAVRLACRAARDALDARRTTLQGRSDTVAPLVTMAPRLRSLEGLAFNDLLEDFGGLGDALAALPSPQLLTFLELGDGLMEIQLDADDLGADEEGAARVSRGLARLTGLRAMRVNWRLHGGPWAPEGRYSVRGRAAAALAAAAAAAGLGKA